MSDQIKPINSKETVEVIKFLAQYEKEKVYDSLNKIDNIRNTVNKFYPFILIALTLRLESFENIQKIIALILFSILTFVLAWINWDITVLSGFSSKSIMKEIYGETKTLKPNSFYNTKINNKEELIWNYTLNGYLSRLKDTEDKIQILFELRKAFFIVGLVLSFLMMF
jgi:hypothetical protein